MVSATPHNTSYILTDYGGTLDAVISRCDVGCPQTVQVVDVGLYDYHLLQWTINTARQVPHTTVVHCRPWRRLDFDYFRSALSSPRLCQLDSWP